jgi:tetratricopeptide (TPR) repeat protein
MLRKLLIAMALLAALRVHSGERWLHMRSPNFDLITNSGAGPARAALLRFELIRAVLRSGVEPARSAPPVRIFLFASERDLRPYTPRGIARLSGYYAPGAERDYIAMFASGDLYRTVFHEYVHLYLEHAGPRLPLWWNEGTAELYSTLRFEGGRAFAGAPIPAHLRLLRSSDLLDLGTLFAVTRDSPLYSGGGKSLFYAQSWAFAHMLTLDPRYRDSSREFVRRVTGGEAPERALEAVYHRTTAQALADLKQYVRQDAFRELSLPVDDMPALEKTEPEILGAVEAGLALSDLQVAVERTADAAEHLRQLAALDAQSPAVHERMAEVLLSRNQRGDALAEYERSIALGTASARVYFEAASLVRDAGGGAEQVEAYLLKAIELDSGFADARALLGLAYLGAGRDADAAVQLERAARLAPGKVWIWQNLAVARYNLGDGAGGAEAARHARSLASTAEEIAMSEAALRLVEPGRPASAARDEVSKAWQNPQGDARLEGKLVRLDCLATYTAFHVLADGRDVALLVADPSKVARAGAGAASVELACGEWKRPRDVTVEYIARPDARRNTAGEVTRIEFK